MNTLLWDNMDELWWEFMEDLWCKGVLLLKLLVALVALAVYVVIIRLGLLLLVLSASLYLGVREGQKQSQDFRGWRESKTRERD